MQSEHQCFTGASGRRGWEPIVLQRDQCSMKRKMVSDGKVKQGFPLNPVKNNTTLEVQVCLLIINV